VKLDLPYDRSFVPPAPILVIGLARPGSLEMVAVPMIVDSGADCTIVPASLARGIQLPTIDHIEIVGVGGTESSAPVHAALLQITRRQTLHRVVALGNEGIAGRDLLAQLVVILDGPLERMRVAERHRRVAGGRPRL
jgi:predicted aspartyl protease